ncbi:MAG: TerB family tellurite resistance protein [Pseudomonadota bacterium]
MFKAIMETLGGKSASTEDPLSVETAMAVLHVRLARSDGDYDAKEIALIKSELSGLFDLSKQEAAEHLHEAESLDDGGPDHVRFTKVLKDDIAYEHRGRLVESLWKVALADGVRDFEEDGFMRLIVNLLGVNDRDSALARQRAQKTLS